MNIVLIIALALLVSATAWALGVVVSHDGYGHRPLPRSHDRDQFTPPFAA